MVSGPFVLRGSSDFRHPATMRLRTWHVEGVAVGVALVSALFLFGKAGDWREWVAALGVQLGFHHASVADRLRESEEARPVSAHSVECVSWLHRYFVGKEVAWVVYFLSTGAISALVGCGVFIAHPFWRRWYRARWPRAIAG
jgi:hypothetical protein